MSERESEDIIEEKTITNSIPKHKEWPLTLHLNCMRPSVSANQETGRDFQIPELRECKILNYILRLHLTISTVKR